MKKVIIIGSPGAGKSTFARALADKTGLPLYYLDMLWHKPDKTNISPEEFDEKLLELTTRDKWIIDGNYARTISIRLESCDTVFLLDYPMELCLESVRSRIGTPREDMPWVETEEDEEFMEWIRDFPQTQLPKIYRALRDHPQKEIHIFKSREESARFLAAL